MQKENFDFFGPYTAPLSGFCSLEGTRPPTNWGGEIHYATTHCGFQFFCKKVKQPFSIFTNKIQGAITFSPCKSLPYNSFNPIW